MSDFIFTMHSRHAFVFLTYFCLLCNELSAGEKMGGGTANRGRRKAWELFFFFFTSNPGSKYKK